MLVTVSTESMFNMEEALLDKASLYRLTVFILCPILAFFAVGFFVKPFRAIVKFLDRVAEGGWMKILRRNPTGRQSRSPGPSTRPSRA